MWSVLVVSDDGQVEGAACAGCLATDVTLYDIHSNNLADSFVQIVGLPVSNPWSRQLCALCRAALRRCTAFRRRCRTAHELLAGAAATGTKLSPAYLRELGQKIKPQYTRTDVTTLEITQQDNLPDIKQEDSTDSDDFLLSTLENSRKLKVNVEKEEIGSDKEELESEREVESDSDKEIEPLPVFADSVKKEVKKKTLKVKKERRKKKCKSADEIKTDADTFNFDVIFLSREEQIREVAELKNKEIKYMKNDRKCELCGKNFKSKRSREAHYSRYHDASVGSFSCDVCHCRFKAKNRLNTHMKIHRERFRCRNCDFVTNRESGLRLHYQWHQGKKYICEYCKKDFSKVSSYMSHVRLIHASLLPWCELCGESFIGEKGIQAHKKRAHKDIEAATVSCENCNTGFLSEPALEKHRSWDRCDLSNCVQCGDAFASLQLLKYHLVQRHGVEGRLTSDCAGCGVRFHSGAARRRHAAACGAPAACVQCGAPFPDEAALKRHEAEAHAALNLFKCEECDKTFTNVYYFRDHCARGHEHARRPSGLTKEKQPPRKRGRKVDSGKEGGIRKWRVVDGERRLEMERLAADGRVLRPARVRDAVCEVCGKAFANVSLLKLHQRLHTGEKLFTCSYCGKKFNVSTLLRNHMRVHTGERPYRCGECPKAFKEWAGYKRHQLSHTGERRHECSLCQKAFLTSTCVKVHIRTVHMKIPMPPRVRRPRVKHE